MSQPIQNSSRRMPPRRTRYWSSSVRPGRPARGSRPPAGGSARAGSRGRPARLATRRSSVARSPYDAPRSLTASSLRKVSERQRLGQPVGEDLRCRRPRRRTPSCPGGRSAPTVSTADPAVGLHAGEDAVDLLVGGVPEEADRLLEAPRELEPGARALAQGDEERVFEGHAEMVADLCNELQAGVTQHCVGESDTVGVLQRAHGDRVPGWAGTSPQPRDPSRP